MRQWGDPAPVQVCATPNAHHPRRLSYRAPEAAPAVPRTDEEAAAAAEARKAERRELVANNKAWDAADEVRRAWLVLFLQRKSMPKDAAVFKAVALTRYAHTRDAYGSVRAIDLLALTDTGYARDTLAAWAIEHPTKGLRVALAVLVAGFENASSRNWWRYPSAEASGYLTQLAAWGYTLSPIERTAASTDTDTESAAA